MSQTANQATRPAILTDTLIIGAGVSGLGAAMRLLDEGMRDFVVLEKAASLGGTWRDNTYPGCACDVPSALYSYSFAQNPSWSRLFAGQQEILDYLNDTAAEHGVAPWIHYNTEVLDSHWDESSGRWHVRTSGGEYQARTLISCAGYLHEPQIPAIPGLQEFPGKLFHSSQWDHDYSLAGKRVAVIGSGASAVQFVPEIQPQVDQLYLYQRTAHWVLPKPDRTVSEREKALYKLPLAMNAWRQTLYSSMEALGLGFRYPRLMRTAQKAAEAHIRRQVPDPELRKKLTPGYTLGCKRVLMSNNYYPALTQANVDVLATGVTEVRGNTLIGADGSEREVDVIILGTGFHVSDAPIAQCIRSTDGEILADRWAGSPEAYLGTTIHGFPNLFIILGPNLAIGHNSAFIIIEAQIDYVLSALKNMHRKKLKKVEVRADVQTDYNRKIQRDLEGTVWNTGGCASYYIDENGKNSICFPWTTVTMRRLMRRFDPADYSVIRL